MTTVFVDGGAGTTGLEIVERLAPRTDLSLVVLDEARRKDPRSRHEALNDADFVILCLPDDAAREAVTLIDNPRTRIIDASSAHRVAEGWTYGFSELGHNVAAANRVSNPGCYPTGFLALVAPLVRVGIIPPDHMLSVNATSGFSGGGKAMIAEYERGDAPALRPYALSLGHKHVGEMRLHAGLTHEPLFAPAVANTYRGMIVEVPLQISVSLGAITDALHAAYSGSPLVAIAGGDSPIAIEEHAGTDRMTLRVCGNDEAAQVRLVATLDNLGKGAAGAAVQNLNLMAGLDPLAGLIL